LSSPFITGFFFSVFPSVVSHPKETKNVQPVMNSEER